MTLACARCHDHKYDPLPTADYYSLYGIFASSKEPDQLPLVGEPDLQTPAYTAFHQELEKRQQAVRDYVAQARTEILTQLRGHAGDYLLAVAQANGKVSEGVAVTYEHGNPRDKLRDHWKRFLEQRTRQSDPIFTPLVKLADLSPANFTEQSAELLAHAGEDASPIQGINPRLLTALSAQPLHSILDVTRTYGRLFGEIETEWQAALAAAPDNPPSALSDASAEELRRALHGPGSITGIPTGEESGLYERDIRDHLRSLERKIEEWQVASPDAPPRAMAIVDRQQPQDAPIFLRGDANRPGDRVPRRPPQLLTNGVLPAVPNRQQRPTRARPNDHCRG